MNRVRIHDLSRDMMYDQSQYARLESGCTTGITMYDRSQGCTIEAMMYDQSHEVRPQSICATRVGMYN
jgi:hypothetical protein